VAVERRELGQLVVLIVAVALALLLISSASATGGWLRTRPNSGAASLDLGASNR